MNIFTGIKQLITGARKARRDYRKILAHSKEHHERHDRFPEWSCAEWNAEFYESAQHPVDIDTMLRPVEAAAYTMEAARLQAKHMRGRPINSTIKMLTVELSGDEKPEDIPEKIMRAVQESLEFDAMNLEERVSETKDDKKKKGGK